MKYNGELYTCFKKITHVLIALISSKALLKPTKTEHHWTPQLIKNMKSFVWVHRVNETKVTGAYVWCGRNKAFNCDFFVETDFVSGYTDGY